MCALSACSSKLSSELILGLTQGFLETEKLCLALVLSVHAPVYLLESCVAPQLDVVRAVQFKVAVESWFGKVLMHASSGEGAEGNYKTAS